MLRFIVTAFAMLALAIPAQAQTVAAGAKLASFLETVGKELAQGNSNLLDMSAGMQDAEYSSTKRVYDAATDALLGYDQLLLVVNIYTLMQDSRDKAIVKKFVGLAASSAVRRSDTALKFVNRELVRIRSPAAIGEVQKVRDLIQKIRDEIQRTVPGS
jgi:hypothetical protein